MSFIIDKELDIDVQEEEKLCEILGQDIEQVNYYNGVIKFSIEFTASKGYEGSWDYPGEPDEITSLDITIDSVLDQEDKVISLTKEQEKQLAEYIKEKYSDLLDAWCFEYLDEYQPDYDPDID